MLRDAALVWIRSHLPDPRFQRDFENHLDDADARGLTCFLVIGPGLTTDGEPYLMHCFCGELFIFQLTHDQARNLKVQDNHVHWGTGLVKDRMQSVAEPAVALSGFEIEQAESLRSDTPLIAHVLYETTEGWLAPSVLRLDYDVPGMGSGVSWHYLDGHMPRKGRIKCFFNPFRQVIGKSPASGTIAVFLRLCTLPDPLNTENRLPISNICAALVTVLPATA